MAKFEAYLGESIADQKFFEILPSLGTYRSLLCLNGLLPNQEFFSHFSLPIIAADGAFNSLKQVGITADIIVGDCDSVTEPIGEKTKKVISKEQFTSDFQKALQFAQENNLLPSIILGINGGFIDHILNNIGILMQTDSISYISPNLCLTASNNMVLSLPLETKLSLFGVPSGRISTKGLRWELKNQVLHFPENNSCFNRTVKEIVEFKIDEGVIFFVIYLKDIIDEGKNLNF